MSNKMCTLRLDELYCRDDTGESSGHDEIYFKIWIDGSYWGTYPKNADDSNTFDMDDGDDNHKKVSLDLTLEYGDRVTIEMREQDKASKPEKDDIIDKVTIYTSDVDYGDTSVQSYCFVGENAHYDLSWRLLSQKIPSLRILGIACQQSSCNCDADIIEAVTDMASNCADAAAKVIGKSKNPEAQVMKQAFKTAANIIEGIGKVSVWMANAVEGDDDVYLQETYTGEKPTDGAGFCPEDGGVIKMDDDQDYCFTEEYDKYFRFPLDKGVVTIELREKDKVKGDICLGSFEVDMNEYDKLKGQGATVMVLTDFLDNHGGQGAIYHVCYSVALEDWSQPANQDMNAEKVTKAIPTHSDSFA